MLGSTDWDGAAYDRVADPQQRWGQTVLARLYLDGSETVLDAGCGSGRVTEALLCRLPHGRVIALDASSSMLAQARSRLSSWSAQTRFVQANLLDLEPATIGEDAPVDAVFSTATFHWITDHELLFQRLASVMRPGGQLVAQCGAQGNISRVIEAVRSLGVSQAENWLYASPRDTTARLQLAGFIDIEVWTNEEPVSFDDEVVLAEFLETVCLRETVAAIPEGPRRKAFIDSVIDRLPEHIIDYVRLNIVARKG